MSAGIGGKMAPNVYLANIVISCCKLGLFLYDIEAFKPCGLFKYSSFEIKIKMSNGVNNLL